MNRLTCAYWGLALRVDLVEEPVARNTAIARECIHHTAVRSDREGAAEEHGPNHDDLRSVIRFRPACYAKHHTHHEHDRALLTDGVQEDLRDRLSCRARQRRVEVLDAKQQPQNQEPPQHSRHANRHDDADGPRHRRIVSLLGHLHGDTHVSIRSCTWESRVCECSHARLRRSLNDGMVR